MLSRIAFLAALTLAAPAFAQARYFADMADLPLPPGFSESAPAHTFETQEGFLIIAEAEGVATGLAVRDFYSETLPALGWAISPRDDGVLMYQRARERLTFTFEQAGPRARLGVRVAVATGPSAN